MGHAAPPERGWTDINVSGHHPLKVGWTSTPWSQNPPPERGWSHPLLGGGGKWRFWEFNIFTRLILTFFGCWLRKSQPFLVKRASEKNEILNLTLWAKRGGGKTPPPFRGWILTSGGGPPPHFKGVAARNIYIRPPPFRGGRRDRFIFVPPSGRGGVTDLFSSPLSYRFIFPRLLSWN